MDAKQVDPVLVSKLLENISYALRTLSAKVAISHEGIFISEKTLHGLSVEIKGDLSDMLIPNVGYIRPEAAVRLCAERNRYVTRDAFDAIDAIDSALAIMVLDDEITEETVTPEFLCKAYESIGGEFLHEEDEVLDDKLRTFLLREGLLEQE